MEDTYFMKIALEEAENALEQGSLPVGAVVAKAGEVLSSAHRSVSDHYLGHAEINALRSALPQRERELSSLVLYSTLEPCVMCLGTLIHCGISRVVFALEDPWGGARQLAEAVLIDRHKGRLPTWTAGVGRAASLELFRRFGNRTKEPFWRDRSNPLVRLFSESGPVGAPACSGDHLELPMRHLDGLAALPSEESTTDRYYGGRDTDR